MSAQYVVSMDSGHSVMKGATWDGGNLVRSSFQAIAEPVQEQQAMEVDYAIQVDGVWYAMQESGRLIDSSKEIQLAHSSFHGSTGQTAQMCWFFEKNNIFGKQLYLIISVPYSDSKDKLLIEKLKSRRVFEWTSQNGESRNVEFEEVIIYPQGVGALRFFQAYTGLGPKKVSMIDIGSITLDIVSLRKFNTDAPYKYNVGASGSIREGAAGKSLMDDSLSRIRDINGLTNVTESYHDISDRMQYKEYKITSPGGVVRDVEGVINQSRKEFTLNSVKRCKGIINHDWENTDAFILSGGISLVLDLAQWECRGRTYLTSPWANTLGQLYQNLDDGDQEQLKIELKKIEKVKFLDVDGNVTEI